MHNTTTTVSLLYSASIETWQVNSSIDWAWGEYSNNIARPCHSNPGFMDTVGKVATLLVLISCLLLPVTSGTNSTGISNSKLSVDIIECNDILCVSDDDRPCIEKLQGPFDGDSYLTPPVVTLRADESNSVTVHCRVTCQDPSGDYTPLLRVVTTDDGKHYQSGQEGSHLYNLTPLILANNDCDFSSNVTEFEYMYQIVAKSSSVNRSIVMCGLQYIPDGGHNSEMCFSSSVALILLPEERPPKGSTYIVIR